MIGAFSKLSLLTVKARHLYEREELLLPAYVDKESGYQMAGLCRECYLDGVWNKENEEAWLTEIQLTIA